MHFFLLEWVKIWIFNYRYVLGGFWLWGIDLGKRTGAGQESLGPQYISDTCRKRGKEGGLLARDWVSSAVLRKSNLNKWPKQKWLIRGVFSLAETSQPLVGSSLGEVWPYCECLNKSKCKTADGHHSTMFFTKFSAEGRSHWHFSRDNTKRRERKLRWVSRSKFCHWWKIVQFGNINTNNGCKSNLKIYDCYNFTSDWIWGFKNRNN